MSRAQNFRCETELAGALAEEFGSGEHARRESLALIRSFLIDSGRSQALREASCAKIFCGWFALHHTNSDAKSDVQR